TDQGRHGTDVPARPYDEVPRRRSRLQRRVVDIEPDVVESAVAHVADDADNRAPDAIAIARNEGRNEKPLADRVLARPESPRRALAHDRDARRLGAISVIEIPAADEPDPHRREVVARRHLIAQTRIAVPAGRSVRLAVEHDPRFLPDR